ncbi:TrpR YerC/YecD [Candidatus Nomurabacteria bacterium]|nr:TrpR YerC/YecD [Candidatus Nomurabacteria bacterium]
MKSSLNYNQQLFQAFLQLKNSEELGRFCHDLLSPSEIREVSARFQAAKMLKNKISYQVIIAETGLSSATIAKISRNLKNSRGGYKLAFKRLSDRKLHLEKKTNNC